jgi:hypothetical protein
MKRILCALLLAAAPVGIAQASAPTVTDTEAQATEADETEADDADEAGEDKKKDDFDIGQMMAVFDKLFPAQPDPLPARLALSRVTVQSIFPDGTYAQLMDDVMDSFVDRIMNLSESDFGAKTKDGKPASQATLRDAAIKEDPHFEERMRIMERVITEEVGKLGKIMEPRLREGLARSMARRFDEKQLGDINAFLATDSGRAFGSQSMSMWVDADVMRAMVGSVPEVITAMPAAMQRLETETAHLPKPKKKDEAKEDADKAE